MKKKSLVLIGLGEQMQSETISAIKSCEDIFEVTAICDLRVENLNKVSEIFLNVKKYTDYKKAIDSHKLDLVYISLPHNMHTEVTEYAINRGVKVIKEKPLALNIKEAIYISQLASEKKIDVLTLTKRPFYQKYKDAKENLPKLGKIYQYTAVHCVTGGNLHYGWKSKKAEAGGGALINLGYHILDILISYFGKVKESYMFSSSYGTEEANYDVEDAASIINSHESGVYGTFQFNCYTPFKDESITIFGTKGIMFIKKTTLKLFDQQGNPILSNAYPYEGLKATESALRTFYVDDDPEISNLQHHTDLMQTLSSLYQTY